MELVAWAEGMGTCFVTLFTDEEMRKAKEILKIPAEAELITVVPFGYRLDGGDGGGKRRKALSDITFSETYGTPL